jgi:hypothetical protein
MLVHALISDMGYGIKVYSDIRYDVRLRTHQSDVGSSDFRLSPISVITDIGLRATQQIQSTYVERCYEMSSSMTHSIDFTSDDFCLDQGLNES